MKHAIVVLAVLGALLAMPGQAQAVAFSFEYKQSFGTAGSNTTPVQFSTPGGIAVDASGDLWIADFGNKRVMHVTDTGAFILKAGSPWSTPPLNGQLKTDYDVAVDASGDVWVTDYGTYRISPAPSVSVSRIQKFDGDISDTYLSQFGSYGTGDGQFKTPKGVFVDAAGNIWVADSGNNRIQKFNSSGAWQMTFGSLGTSNGLLNGPTDMVVEPGTGHVWVVDNGNNRIQEFTSAGVFIRRIGGGLTGNALGDDDGMFDLPTSLALDAWGNVLVADYGNNRIQAFDGSGDWLLTYGGLTAGSGNGQFNKPYGIAVDPSGRSIWVSDSDNNRIVELNVIPEPVTMAGLALGLSCLTNYIRRRRTA